MLRILDEKRYGPDSARYIEAAGLSTDTKPTDAITGSMYYEVDTGFAYAYDETGHTWTKTTVAPGVMQDAVDSWLEDHPEATTTVQDGAITLVKLNSAAVATTAETTSYLSIT